MTAVPHKPPLPPLDSPAASKTRTGDPVVGTQQWHAYARQMLWLIGGGTSLVAAGPEPDDLAAGSDYTFHYYAWPRVQNTYRMWFISLGCNGGDGAIGTITAGTSDPVEFIVPGGPEPRRGRVLQTVIVVENVPSPAAGDVSFTISVDSDSPDPVVLNGATCHEVPLVAAGSEVDTLRSGEPIYHSDDVTPVSLRAVQIGTASMVEDARRSCLFSVFRLQHSPDDTAGLFIPYADATMPVLARRRYAADGAGNRTIEVAAYGEGDGVVRITASSGDSVDLAFNTEASPVWITGTLMVDAEDPDELESDGGLQSGVRDMLTVEYKSNGAGPNYISVYGFCGGEID